MGPLGSPGNSPWVPLGSPWVPLGPGRTSRLAMEFWLGFSTNQGFFASEVTDPAMIWALEDEFPLRVNANMIQAGKMVTNLDLRSEHSEFIFDLTTTDWGFDGICRMIPRGFRQQNNEFRHQNNWDYQGKIGGI